MTPEYLDRIADWNTRTALPAIGHCALLFIDVQQHFKFTVAGILDNLAVLKETCRKRGVPLFYTRHGHHDPTVDGGMLGVWWTNLIRYGSRNWELIPELAPEEDSRVIDKTRYNAFTGTDLDTRLKSAGIEDVIITGVLTNCCCETTARDAFVRDYRVFFVADATATVSEELHLASLKNLAFGFAYIVSTGQLLRHFNDG